MENIFYELIARLSERNEIQFKNLFVDGTKIEANANRYTFVWKKATINLKKEQNKNLNLY